MGAVTKRGFSLDTLEEGEGFQITTPVVVQVAFSKVYSPSRFRLTLTDGIEDGLGCIRTGDVIDIGFRDRQQGVGQGYPCFANKRCEHQTDDQTALA